MLNALGGGDALEILVAMRDLSGAGFAKLRSEITATEARANSTNFSGFSKASQTAEADAAKLAGKPGGGGIAGLGSNLGAMVVPAGLAIAAVSAFGFEAAEAYQKHEVAVDGMTTSLNTNIPAWKSQAGAIRDATEASVKLGFTDTDTTTALTGLFAATGDVTKATQILSTAQDLARFKKISLQDATEALTKVEAGSYRILKSLGIELPKNATQTEALAAVQKIAGGQAQTYANSDLGAITVASAKVEAAQEKVGAGFSKFEAVTLPAVADALGVVGDEFDALGKAMDKNVAPAEKSNALMALLNDMGGRSIPIFGSLVPVLQAGTDAQNRHAAAAAAAASKIAGEDDATAGLTTTESLHHSVAIETADDIAKIGRAADMAATMIPGLASAISDDLFGKAITTGSIQKLKDTNKELEKQRDHMKKNSPAWIEATGEIAANNKAMFDLGLQQAQKAGPAAVVAFLNTAKTKYGDVNGEIARMITLEKAEIPVVGALLSQLAKLTVGRYAGKTIPLFAEGGHYEKDQPRIVGDDGPELDIPDHSGTIVPKSRWGQYTQMPQPALAMGASSGLGGGGGITVVHTHIYLDGRPIAELVDQHRYRSDALAPTSTRGF